jgi:predicted amidohydrolase YtcJ
MSGGPDLLAPDLILLNGSIHTVDDANPSATAVAIRNGRFIAVGDDEIRDLAGPSTRVEDLDGATVVPGLIDAHNHLEATGRDLGNETEALTVEQAPGSYTLGGAFVTGREDHQGSIAPGKLADLVFLDRDPLATPPDELEHVRPIAAVLGEAWVYPAS